MLAVGLDSCLECIEQCEVHSPTCGSTRRGLYPHALEGHDPAQVGEEVHQGECSALRQPILSQEGYVSTAGVVLVHSELNTQGTRVVGGRLGKRIWPMRMMDSGRMEFLQQ